MTIDNKLVKVICAILFCVFTFSYLFFYQADILRVTQHIASGGQTFYVPWLGGVLITIFLQLLQVGLNSILHLKKRGVAMTYFPSVLVLIAITDISPNVAEKIEFHSSLWVLLSLFVIYIPIILYVKKYEPYEPELRSYGPVSQSMWINLCFMFIMFLMVGTMANHDRRFHERARIESLVVDGDYKGALQLIKQFGETDSVTSMLTIYSVARTGHLGDELFEYPLVGGSTVLRPGKVHSLLLPDSLINNATKTSANYQLIGFLLDKDLRGFMNHLPHYYPTDSLLPRYYKEAKLIYLRGVNKRMVHKGMYSYYFLNAKP